MIVYPAEWNRRKDSAFASIAAADGGGQRLAFIGLSFRDFPETRARTTEALVRAKRQPKGALGRFLKRTLIRAQYNWSRRYFTRHPDRIALAWNGLTGSRRAFMMGAKDAGAARLFAELAPFPGRMTLDPEGVNAENMAPRDPEFYRDWAASQPRLDLDDWRALGANLTARQSRRADVGQAGADALAGAPPFLFVPLQVPGDSQITLFSGWTGDLPGFIAALADAAAHLPEGWQIRIKEHPSARISLAEPLAAAVARAGGRIVVDNATDTFAQVAGARAVLTVNSSVGLQAFFFDRPVIVAGQAFFALPGLVAVADSPATLADAIAGSEALAFDPTLRGAFMTWLDRVYYPRVTETEGRWTVDPDQAREKIAEARARATAAPRPTPGP